MIKNIKTAKIIKNKLHITYTTKDEHPLKAKKLIQPINSKEQLAALLVIDKEGELVSYLQKSINK